MNYVQIVIVFIAPQVFLVECSRILMVFNHFGKSHYIQGKALGKGLASYGHEVTMVSPFEDKEKERNVNYTEIVLDGLLETVEMDTNFINNKEFGLFFILVGVPMIFVNYVDNTLKHPKFQKLLNSNEKFDLIILEELYNAALKALSCHFQAPLILYHPINPTNHLNEDFDIPAPSAFVPHVWFGFTSKMTFLERTQNFLMNFLETLINYNVYYPTQNTLIRKYFPACPKLNELNKNVSLVLINTHESVNDAIPTVPAVINILGFHLKENNSLPTDLQLFMDNASEGVILFSFGSFVNPSAMDPEIKMAFMKSLGKLKQKVLWKTDEDFVNGKPDNVKLSKWLPQEDILAHPNTKLFITHGGFTSLIETLYHRVPVLAIPFIADQKTNAIIYVKLDVGLTLNLEDITENKLDAFLIELLSNKSYAQNARKISQLLRDRPLKPMETAKYWVEYVIRNKGAPHLRVAGLDLPWYQHALLDVLLFLIFVIVILWNLFVLFLRMFLKKNKEKQS